VLGLFPKGQGFKPSEAIVFVNLKKIKVCTRFNGKNGKLGLPFKKKKFALANLPKKIDTHK
jgi:hypothetical protein